MYNRHRHRAKYSARTRERMWTTTSTRSRQEQHRESNPQRIIHVLALHSTTSKKKVSSKFTSRSQLQGEKSGLRRLPKGPLVRVISRVARFCKHMFTTCCQKSYARNTGTQKCSVPDPTEMVGPPPSSALRSLWPHCTCRRSLGDAPKKNNVT